MSLKRKNCLLVHSILKILVLGVINNRVTLDEEIDKRAINWSIERIGYVERNIWWIALFEIQEEGTHCSGH